MKKAIALALAAIIIILTFAGCTLTGSGSNETYYTTSGNFVGTAVQTITDGKLTVAISPDFAPMEFVDPTKTGQTMYVGFDVILASYIADELGLELVIMPLSFDACQTAVYTGTVDMSVSGFSWTPDRAEKANLSDYYYAGDNEDKQVLITLKAYEGMYDTVEKLTGVKIGAQNASLQQSLAQAQLPDSELVLFTDMGTAVLQLKSGDFVGMVVADGNADAIIASNPEIIKSGFEFAVDASETGNVVMLQKGADDMTKIVNEILAQSQPYWGEWYDVAQSISGINQSYDDDGNAITDTDTEAQSGQFIPNVIDILQKYWKLFLFEGLKNTLILTFISVLMGTLLGAVVALAKMSKCKPLQWLMSIYVEVIRGTPILLQLYIFYFVLPNVLPFLKLSQFMWVSIALCVNSAAYVSEVIRSGIQAVDKGQTEAARSLGMSESQTMTRIILPQAVRNILPALGNEFIMMLKETSLASTFFLYDLMTVCNVVKGATYLTLEPMTIVALIYLCMTFPLSKLVGHLEKKMANPNSYRARKRTKKEAK